MNSLELRGYIGNLRGQEMKGQKTKEETIAALQNIDWSNIEELEFCPISSLQNVVNNYIATLQQ
jgi:hypothetical protein